MYSHKNWARTLFCLEKVPIFSSSQHCQKPLKYPEFTLLCCSYKIPTSSPCSLFSFSLMTAPFPFFLPQDTTFHWSSGLLKEIISCWHTSPQLVVLRMTLQHPEHPTVTTLEALMPFSSLFGCIPSGCFSASLAFLMSDGYGTDWWKFTAISSTGA